jgi:quercetin dioxygenase-like cupin family protein
MTTAPDRITKETLGTGAYDPREWRSFDPTEGKVNMMYMGDEDIANIVVWCLEPGQENSTHTHPDSAHIIYIMEGEGLCLRGDQGQPDPIKAGQLLIVPRNVIHGIRNTGNVNLSYVAASAGVYKRDAVGEQAGRFGREGGH